MAAVLIPVCYLPTYPTSHPSIYFMSFTAEIDMNEDERLIAPKSILGTAMTAGKISIIDGSAEWSRISAHWMCVMSVERIIALLQGTRKKTIKRKRRWDRHRCTHKCSYVLVRFEAFLVVVDI